MRVKREKTGETVRDKQGLWGARLFCFETLPSTQDWARDRAATLKHGDVVWARRQTRGRGRFDRTWLAARDSGLAVTVLLQPGDNPFLSAPVTQAAAVAVCGALQARQIAARLKWPNDVLVANRKIAGILAEHLPEHDAIVLGIGINVNMTPRDFAALPASKPATSLRIETGATAPVRALLDEVLRCLASAIEGLATNGPEQIAAFWSRNDALTGRRILVAHPDGKTVAGLYRGLSPDGALLMDADNGERREFWSGEVGIVPL